MSKQANPALIGLFIVMGLALGVAGLLLFGSSRLFTRSYRYVVYFNSSLNGLNEGAPVKYRGVTIGTVERVMIRFNQATNDTGMPVVIQIRDDLIRKRWVGPVSVHDFEHLDYEVRRGLRASLETESLVTGVLYVSLEVFQNPPPPVYHQLKKTYPEIPTRPNDIQRLMNNLARIDLNDLVERLNALITRIDFAVDRLNAAQVGESLTNLLTSLNRVVNSPDLTNSLAELTVTIAQYRRLAEKIQDQVDPLADNINDTLTRAGATLAQIQAGMQNLRGLLDPDSPLRNELAIALDQLGQAAQSIAALTDYLQAHPNALITGRRASPHTP